NLRRRHVAALDQRLVAAWARLARRSGFTRFVGFVCVNCIARVAMHARGLVTDHGFDRVREDHFAFAAPAVDGAAEFFFAHFTFHIICASKENNADNLSRLNHSYYLDRRPKRPAADRGLKSVRARPRWPLPRGGRGRPSRGRGAAARNVRKRRSYPRVGVWSFTPGTPRAADNAGIEQTHLGLATCPF